MYSRQKSWTNGLNKTLSRPNNSIHEFYLNIRENSLYISSKNKRIIVIKNQI